MADVRKHRREKVYGQGKNVPDCEGESREALIVSLLGSMNTPEGVTFKVEGFALGPTASTTADPLSRLDLVA
eukprot:9473796-Pyramimonas_sp.AAC.1